MKLHHGVSENRLGHRRAIHDGVGSQRISLGVATAIGLDISDLTVIDDRNRHALGVGVGHDFAHFGVDDSRAWNRL